ncbi:hypothetical protein ABPG72_009715 [Tetrahymena utriculariae]
MYNQNKIIGRPGMMQNQQGMMGANLANNGRMLGQNSFLMNQQNGNNQQQYNTQNMMMIQQQQQQQQQFLNGVKTCKWHKGQVYIAICSYDQCKMGRLCCLRCMVSKHTDHTQHLILLDELRDSDLMSLSVPTNWTNTLGPLKDDIQSIIRICRVSDVSSYLQCQEDEVQKIDEMFDTFTKEIIEDIEKLRSHVKGICVDKNQTCVDRFIKLAETLRKVLNPQNLLNIVDDFITESSSKNEQIQKSKNIILQQQQAEQELEDQLNTFFTTARVSQEDQDNIYKNYNFLCKKEQQGQIDMDSQNYFNWNALNEIREQIQNIMQNKVKFAEIFFPDQVLYNKYENLDKVRSLTSVYDEITNSLGQITNVEPIDNERFMVIRDVDLMEVWNIDQHKREYSYCIAGQKSLITPIKTKSKLLVAYASALQTSIQIADTQSKKIIKSFSLPNAAKSIKLLSAKDENNTIIDQILLAILLDTGEVKIINVSKNNIIDLKNKNTTFMEILPEIRCYQQQSFEDSQQQQQQIQTSQGIINSYGIITASNDLLSIWYPLSSKCVRNIKVIMKPNETLKQIGSFEITNYEKQQTFFSDSVAGCPSKTAIAMLTNKSLRIFNWFKANCVREIPVEDCNNFQILQSFIQKELKNIFLLYNVGENKPAEYATCDWSTQKVEYWNSGSLTNFTCIKTLNQHKILEIGKHNAKGSESKKGNNGSNILTFEVRARIKSLN